MSRTSDDGAPSLVGRLLASAAFSPGRRAAIRLLVAHGVWLADERFLTECVEVSREDAWITWRTVPGFAMRSQGTLLAREVLLLATDLAEAENVGRFRGSPVFGELDEETYRRLEGAIGDELGGKRL